MKLLKVQVDKLYESLEKLRSKYLMLKEYRKADNKNCNYTTEGFTDLADMDLAYEINSLSRQIDELELMLKTCEIIDVVASEEISVGSEFTATVNFFGEEEKEKYILAENCEKIEGYRVVTVATPLGASVLGKKEGQTFSYTVGTNVFNGIVNEIHIKSAKEKTIVK